MNLNYVLMSALAATLVLSSCAVGDSTETAATEQEASPSEPTTTVTETIEAEPECEMSNPLTTRLIAESWTLVVASKGADDHGRYTRSFADEVKELVEDFEDSDCSEGDAMVVVTEMSYEAGLVAFPHEVSPPASDAENEHYDAVAKLGNEMFEVLGIEKAQFIPIACAGQVDTTAECTGLS